MASTGIFDTVPGSGPVERVLGGHRGLRDGPTLICIGGLHGNEPAGVHGIRRVAEALADRVGDLRGEFVGLSGNRTALAHGSRFVHRDLNRAWTPERVARVRADSAAVRGPEDEEQAELIEEIERTLAAARGPVYVLDLHTTSGAGGIFSVFSDTLPQRAFASRFPVPMILGLEELVDGTLINYLGERGVIAVTVETGRHDAPESVDRAAAAVWVAVRAAGLLPPARVPEAREGERMLRRASAHLPAVLEMRYRHPVAPEDGFAMLPGFRNFDRVAEGQVVAGDASGEIVAREDARLLMPLYQKQGEDGFFLVREFSPFWMSLSSALRHARADRLGYLLPGVRRVPDDPHAVIVDKRVARFFARQLFHLLGFRRVEDQGAWLVMRRRPFDFPEVGS